MSAKIHLKLINHLFQTHLYLRPCIFLTASNNGPDLTPKNNQACRSSARAEHLAAETDHPSQYIRSNSALCSCNWSLDTVEYCTLLSSNKRTNEKTDQ